jgi:hypothetical protein
VLWLEAELGERGLGKNTDSLELLRPVCDLRRQYGPFSAIKQAAEQKYAVYEPCAISALSEQDTEVMNEGI